MSFFRHHPKTSRAGETNGAPGIAGTEACAHPGCPNQNGIACSYFDRRNRPCGYALCPQHQKVFEARPYCRRHGGVMHAITTDTVERIEPPDLDNRALSLCEWIANDLDAEVVVLLEEIKQGAKDAVVRTHPLHLVLQRQPPSRTWARTWTLGDHSGTMRKIGVEVNEAADTIVIASVDSNVVAEDVPPWISDRTTPIGEEAVQKRRDDFRVTLVGSIVWSAKNAERPWVAVT